MLKHPKRPRDPFSLAVEIGRQATGQIPKPSVPSATAMAERGRNSGLKGGKARAKSLPAKRRRAIARQAARTRWGVA